MEYVRGWLLVFKVIALLILWSILGLCQFVADSLRDAFWWTTAHPAEALPLPVLFLVMLGLRYVESRRGPPTGKKPQATEDDEL